MHVHVTNVHACVPYVQVASFLQDDRTLHCVTSLLAGAMRAGMLACMPPGSEDAPAAYAWQAVAAVTELSLIHI